MLPLILFLIQIQLPAIENTIVWYEAAGPVEGYETQISTDGGLSFEFGTQVQTNSVILSYPAFTPIVIRVRAYSSLDGQRFVGTWSDRGYLLIVPKLNAPTHKE